MFKSSKRRSNILKSDRQTKNPAVPQAVKIIEEGGAVGLEPPLRGVKEEYSFLWGLGGSASSGILGRGPCSRPQ